MFLASEVDAHEAEEDNEEEQKEEAEAATATFAPSPAPPAFRLAVRPGWWTLVGVLCFFGFRTTDREGILKAHVHMLKQDGRAAEPALQACSTEPRINVPPKP